MIFLFLVLKKIIFLICVLVFFKIFLSFFLFKNLIKGFLILFFLICKYVKFLVLNWRINSFNFFKMLWLKSVLVFLMFKVLMCLFLGFFVVLEKIVFELFLK